jgi:hypothetical protein
MSRDDSSGRNWASCRQSTSMGRNDPYLHIPGTTFNKEGLHKNCKDCNHIVDKACKFVKFPRVRKWPCYFKENV